MYHFCTVNVNNKTKFTTHKKQNKMKKFLSFALIAIMALGISSCSKTEEAAPAGSWKLGNTTYTQAFSMKVPTGVFVQYLALDKIYTSAELSNNSNSTKTFNGFALIFKTAPTASGKYKIVVRPDPSLLAADEMLFTMQDVTRNKSYYAANTSVLADVTVNAGKITVVIPETKVLQEGTQTPETLAASGTFVEQ
jgi:hypothetical protein